MKYALCLLGFVLVQSCGSENHPNYERLSGEWKAISWDVKGKESGRLANDVHFEFKMDKTYSASFGGQRESGTFRVDGMKLYTTGENKIEKLVGFKFEGSDTLMMEMNRMGTYEELKLVKVDR